MIPFSATTVLFGVFGNPVHHSLSPAMFHRAFSEAGIDAVYLAFRIRDIGRAVNAVRELNIRGVSVTIPFKTDVIRFLDEMTPLAKQIGAVNTIFNRDGRLCGSNTDCEGAVNAVKTITDVQGLQVALIGAGGAARAIAFGMKTQGARVTIVNRTVEKGEKLAREMDARFRPLRDFNGKDADVIINTTPVGMAPDIDRCPVPEAALHPGQIVMDAIYNPLCTRLLQTAESAGCRTIDGVSMFVRQGALQFETWLGKPAPIQAMEMAVRSALEIS